MGQAFLHHALAEAMGAEQLDGAMFEQSGAHTVLDVLARVLLEDYRLDALLGEEVGEHEARRSGTDDPDLRVRHGPPPAAVLPTAYAE
jgi:hypothetical protein